LAAKARDPGEAPRDEHATAERREYADAPVAELVTAAFDDDRAVIGNDAGGRALIGEVLQEVSGPRAIEIVVSFKTIDGGPGLELGELASQLPDRHAQLQRAAGHVALPERHLAGLAGRRRHG